MDTTKVIVTLLILTIVISVATVAFNAYAGGKTVTAEKSKESAKATVSLNLAGAEPVSKTGNVGLSVVG